MFYLNSDTKMSLYDEYLKKAKTEHSNRDEATQQRWAESQAKSNQMIYVDPITDPNERYARQRADWQISSWSDQPNKWIGWAIDYLSKVATEVWQDISRGAANLISDEQAASWNKFTKIADQAVEIWWDLLWWAFRAIWSTPKVAMDALWLITWDTKWWFWDTKKRAEELQSMWVNKVWSWLLAVEEWSQKDNITWSSDNLFSQLVDQAINNPLAMRWLWQLFKWASKLVKWVSKVEKAESTLAKIEKWVATTEKWLSKVEKWVAWASNIAEDWAKTVAKTTAEVVEEWAKKSNIITKTKNVLNKMDNNPVTRFIKNSAEAAVPWLQAIDDLVIRPWTRLIKWTIQWYKAAWISWALRQWLWNVLEYWLDSAWKFLSQPYSYRLPRVWSYDQAQKMYWDTSDAVTLAKDMQEFYDEHWYSISNVLPFKDEESLKDWYDQQWISEDKRITLAEAKELAWEMWDWFVNNLLSWIRDTLSFMDPWQYNQWYYNAVESNSTGVYEQPETTPRWRLRTSWWLNIDITDATITDDEWNTYNMEDLTEEQKNDVLAAVVWFQNWDYSWLIIENGNQKADWTVNITWLSQNNPVSQIIEWYAQNWMLTQSTVDMLMHWDKSRDAVYITNQLNEASKQFVNKIVDLYTADELNKNPSKQAELLEYFWAYQRFFNATAEIINNSSDSTYNEKAGFNLSNKWVYRYREAMTDALKSLSARDQELINSNLYRQAIDYNNWLEEWFDQTWMELATKIQRMTDDSIVDWILRDDNADFWDKLWLSWLWNTAVNPTMVWSASMWWDVRSALSSNAAYLIDTAVVNFVNNNLVEKLAWWMYDLSKWVLSPKTIAGRWYSFTRGAVTEMSSEPLENLLDAISMVDSSDTNYDFMPWLMIGMMQGWLAWYAWARTNYSTINDYFADPNNRTAILNRLWIDINKIDDPKKKATVLAITNQAFDNLIPVMAKAYAESNYWVESLAQWLALTLINNDMADYATDILNQAQQQINQITASNWWNWTTEQINQVFWNEVEFNKYLNWQNFNFNQSFIEWIRWSKANQTKFNNMFSRAESLIVTAQTVKWNSLQEVFDKMSPKIDKNWLSIKPPLTRNKKDAEQEFYNNILQPWTTAEQQYILQSTFMWINRDNQTIADRLWIWEWSEAWDSKRWTFKKNIEIKWEDWKTQRISFKDYIIDRLNNAELWLTPEQRSFIFSMLFRTSVLWVNSYFKDDWSLSRLWKDFFNSVMPDVAWSNAMPQWQSFIKKDQVTKITNSTKSRDWALQERWSETKKIVNTFMIWADEVSDWWDVSELSDDSQIWSLTKNWKPYTLWDLKKDWHVTFTVNWARLKLIYDSTSWKINIVQVNNEIRVISKEEAEADRQKQIDEYNALSTQWKIDFINNRIESLKKQEAAYYASDNVSEANKILNEINRITQIRDALKKRLEEEWNTAQDESAVAKSEESPVEELAEEADNNVEWTVDITTSVQDKNEAEIMDSEWDTRTSWVTPSQSFQEKLVNKSNEIKTKLPIMKHSLSNSPITLAKDSDKRTAMTMDEKTKILWYTLNEINSNNVRKWAEDFEIDWEAILNSDEAKKEYDIITIIDKNKNARQYYAVPQLNLAIDNQDEIVKEDWEMVWFNSFVLVDTDPELWEHIIKRKSTIFRWDKTYAWNNYIYEVVDKDWKTVKWNRVLNFTKDTRWDWHIATTIQLNRLSYNNRKQAHEKWMVFLTTTKKVVKPSWKVRNYVRKILVPTETDELIEMDYDTREIYTTADMIVNSDISKIRVWDLSEITVTDKMFDVDKDLASQGYKKEANKLSDEMIADLETLVWYDPTRNMTEEDKKIAKQATKDLLELDWEIEQDYEEQLDKAEEATTDPNISEEESINELNKSQDENIYKRAKWQLQVIAANAMWLNIDKYININSMLYIPWWDMSDPKYVKAIENLILVDLTSLDDETAYNLYNRLWLIQEKIEYLLQQNYDEYTWTYYVVSDLIAVVWQKIFNKVNRYATWRQNKVEDAEWMTIEWFVKNVSNNWYLPVEVWISIDDNWKITVIQYWNSQSSNAHRTATSFVHSHPNWSFFSNSDLEWIANDWMKNMWLILPWSVILNFPVDNTFKEVAFDDQWKVKKWLWIHDSLWSTIRYAFFLSIQQWTFDQQNWWAFTDVVKKYKELYDEYWPLDDTTIWSFSVELDREWKKVFDSINRSLSAAAVQSWDVPRYYVYNRQNMTSQESQFIDHIYDKWLPEPNQKSMERNAAIVDRYSAIFDWTQKAQIVSDLEELWLSLASLDRDSLWKFFLAYAEWKWLDDVITMFANETRWAKMDNFLKDLLIKNWVLRKNVDYDWLTLDESISVQWCIDYLTRLKYTNITSEELRNLRNALFNSRELNQVISDRDTKIRFVTDYTIFQILSRCKEWENAVSWETFVGKKINQMSFVLKTLQAQMKYKWMELNQFTEEDICEAITATDWMYWKENSLVDSLRDYYVANVFHMNPNTISDEFKSRMNDIIKQQLESNKIVQLENIAERWAFEWIEFIKELEWMSDWIRYQMAVELKHAWLIWSWVYNYLMKTDPTVTMINEDMDSTWWILSSMIVKLFDKNLLWWFEWTRFWSDEDKVRLFVDIYKFYSLWWTSYTELVNILKNKYDWEQNAWMRYLIDLLYFDSINSQNWIYPAATIAKILERKKTYKWEPWTNPYDMFIKDATDKKAIVDAISQLYYINPDSFFMIIQYAPSDVKKKVADWMKSENEKPHWQNTALWMVLSFLSNARTKELLDSIAKEKAWWEFTDWYQEDIKNAAKEIIKNWDDLLLATNTEITRSLYNATWINWLNPNKWTVLLTKWWDYMPSSWESAEWAITFPLKNVTDLTQLKADVNVLVPEWVKVPKKVKWMFNIIKVKAWVKDWMLLYNPKWSFKSVSTFEWNAISWLWHIWLDMSIDEWFTFSWEELRLINNMKFNKNLYWEIFKQIVVPTLPSEFWNVSQEAFNSLIDDRSMRLTDADLIYASIASKSIEEKVSAAMILMNQVTNWQLAFKTDVAWTQKTIDIQSAYNDFQDKVISLLNEKDPDYWMKRGSLNKFFFAYVATLLRATKVWWESTSIENSWLTESWLEYLKSKHSSAMSLLLDTLKSWWFPISTWAYLPWENVDQRQWENIITTLKEVLEPNKWPRTIAWVDVDERIANKVLAEVNRTKAIARLWQINKLLDKLNSSDDPDSKKQIQELLKEKAQIVNWDYVEDTDIEEDRFEYDTEEDDYSDWREYLSDNDVEDEWETDFDFKETSAVESQNFTDKEAQVFATLFNATISDNLVDMWTDQITYDDKWNNKFISYWVLNSLLQQWWSLVDESVVVKWIDDLDEDSAAIVEKKDLLNLQSILSANKNDTEQLDKILNDLFLISENVDNNDPIKKKFDDIKEMIKRDPDSFTSIIENLINDSSVTFDVKSMELIKEQTFNNVKLLWLQKKIAAMVVNTTAKPLSEEWLEEAHNEYDKYYQWPNWESLWTPSPDQINWTKSIVDMFHSRKDVENSTSLFIPWMAWAWKTTMMVAALRAIQEKAWLYATDIDRINKWTQTIISDNFFTSDAKIIENAAKNKDARYSIKITMANTWASVYVKFQWKDIVSHAEMKNEYNQDKQAFLNKYISKTWNVWTDDWLLRLFEIWEWNERWPNWSWSSTRFFINFDVNNHSDTQPEWTTLISIWKNWEWIHWVWNSVEVRYGKDWKPQQSWPKVIEWKSALEDVYILTKTNSTVQTIMDKIWKQYWLTWVRFATMNSRLMQQSSAWFVLYWYWDVSEIRPDKDMAWKLILIDEAQNSDEPTLKSIIEWYWDKNQMIFLWDTKQMSQSSVFADEVNKWDNNVMPLTTLFRWTEDQQATNKLNSIVQDLIIESWALVLFPSDSNDFVKYNNIEETFDLPWTSMYVARTNDRVSEINRQYFNWAIQNKKPIPAMIIDAISKDTSVSKWEINKRYHEWINLSTYKPTLLNWKTIYVKEDWKDVNVFIPVTKDTNKSTVSQEKSWAEKTYPWKTVRIMSTAFAITTAKESWKTVDNIILDEQITNSDDDYHNESNVRQAYDSFTRWDQKVYYFWDSKKILYAPISQIKALVNEWNPNITITAPNQEVKVSQEKINIPVFWVNNHSQRAVDILWKIQMLFSDDKFSLEHDELDKLSNSLDIVAHIENVENQWLLSLNRMQWTRDYVDQYAVWNWNVLKNVQMSIAMWWQQNRSKIDYKSLEPELKAIYKQINWWTFWRKVSIPKITWWNLFWSYISADSKISFDRLKDSVQKLREWWKWMFYNYKKTINAKWKEVRSLVPAEITWDEKIEEWILSQDKSAIKDRYATDNEIQQQKNKIIQDEQMWVIDEQTAKNAIAAIDEELEEQKNNKWRIKTAADTTVDYNAMSESAIEETTCKL